MNTINSIPSANAFNITTAQSLQREANRRGFGVYGRVSPGMVIPLVEFAIADHNRVEHGYD